MSASGSSEIPRASAAYFATGRRDVLFDPGSAEAASLRKPAPQFPNNQSTAADRRPFSATHAQAVRSGLPEMAATKAGNVSFRSQGAWFGAGELNPGACAVSRNSSCVTRGQPTLKRTHASCKATPVRHSQKQRAVLVRPQTRLLRPSRLAARGDRVLITPTRRKHHEL
jgi:hypothetical protein